MNEEKKKSLSAKKYLEQLQIIDEKITQNLEELELMKLKACSLPGMDYSRERVQTTSSGDGLGNTVVRYTARSQEIDQEIDQLAQAKDKIRRQIQGLNEKNYMQVLFKIYVQYKSIKIAAAEMEKSYSYVVALHKRALEEFEKVYQDLYYLT
ncbi:MAG: hypothetical protein HFH41_10220 [Lachnospiraceae bacterium]|nr:hypothetical protein [Lachnospiraceae bacterium]